jgi:hypothetical protein
MFLNELAVEEFDVLPDEIVLWGDSTVTYDISFHEKEILWSDGYLGSIRTLSKSGKYKVFIVVGECVLEDEVSVYRIKKDERILLSTTLCKSNKTVITLPFKGDILWANGSISREVSALTSSSFLGKVNSACGNIDFEIRVNLKECGIKVFAPNVFSPNDDGLEEIATFYWESLYGFRGSFEVFDRWGNVVFHSIIDEGVSSESRDGRSSFNNVNSGVFIWQINDSTNGNRSMGSITLIE